MRNHLLLTLAFCLCFSSSASANEDSEKRIRRSADPESASVRHPQTEGGCIRYSEVELAFPCRAGEVRKGMMWMGDLLEVIEYELIDGTAVFEGDILLSLDERGNIKAPGKSTGRSLSSYRWPERTVPYVIDAGLQASQPSRVTDAIAHWEANTNLRFVPRTTHSDYVRFVRHPDPGTCNSYVGRQGGRQDVNIGDSCSTGNTIHEIGHAIGLWHEHSRSDRDSFITILWENIESGKESAFKTYAALGQDGFNLGAHDLGSIMHYGSFAFTRNGQPTITRKDGSTFSSQRVGLSAGDIAGANYMYPIPHLVANVTGPSSLGPDEPGTWYCGAGGGVPPYTYYWYKSTALEGFTDLGNGGYVTTSSNVSFKIICDVMDARRVLTSNNIFVNVNGGDPSEIDE